MVLHITYPVFVQHLRQKYHCSRDPASPASHPSVYPYIVKKKNSKYSKTHPSVYKTLCTDLIDPVVHVSRS